MNTITTRDPADPTQTCFVIMPYSKDFNPVLDAIKDAVQSVGLRCNRLDEVEYSRQISDEMAARIAKSQLCIADLTGPNQNVMWEAGYAMALNRPTVLISQDVSTVPFNLKNYPVLQYDLSTGRKAVAREIADKIRATLALAGSRKRRVARWAALAAVLALATTAGLYAAGLQIGLAAPSRCDLIHVRTDSGKVHIADDIYVKLDGVETLQGKREGKVESTLSGHAFNKTYLAGGDIFEEVLKASGLPQADANRIRRMDQKGWDDYREIEITAADKRARLTDYPFAQISVFRGDTALINAEYFFKGETLSVAGLPIKLELTNVYNTKRSSGEPESVALRIVN